MPSSVQVLRGHPPAFELRTVGNRRFMWCARTGELILGGSDVGTSSHAEEHAGSGARGAFHEFVRGWVGLGGSYRHGVIHFAPAFRGDLSAEEFGDVCSTLAVFVAAGAGPQTVLRGSGLGGWETTFDKACPELLSPTSRRRSGNRTVQTSLVHLGAMAA